MTDYQNHADELAGNLPTAENYDVLSPDGFSIFRERKFATEQDAIAGFDEWAKRFEGQGYYSFRGQRIPLADLDTYCEIVEL